MLAFKPPGNEMFVDLRYGLIASGNKRSEWLDQYPFSNWLEKTMEWGDRIAVKHGWTVFDSGVKVAVSGDLLFHESGVNWYRWGPHREKFTPVSGEPFQLTGYPWCTEEFFKQFRDFGFHLHKRSLTADPSGTTLNRIFGFEKWSPSGVNELSEPGHLKQREFWSNIAYGTSTIPAFSQLRRCRKFGRSSQSYNTLATFQNYLSQYGQPYEPEYVIAMSGNYHYPGIYLSPLIAPPSNYDPNSLFVVNGTTYALAPHFMQIRPSSIGFGNYSFLNGSGFTNYENCPWDGVDVAQGLLKNDGQAYWIHDYVEAKIDHGPYLGYGFDAYYQTDFNYCLYPISRLAYGDSYSAEAYPLRSIIGVNDSGDSRIATESAQAYRHGVFSHYLPVSISGLFEPYQDLSLVREAEFRYYYGTNNFNSNSRNHKLVYGFITTSGLVDMFNIYSRMFIATSGTDQLVGDALRSGNYYDLISLGPLSGVYPDPIYPSGGQFVVDKRLHPSFHGEDNPFTFLYPSGYTQTAWGSSWLTREDGISSGSLLDLLNHQPPPSATCLFIAEIIETPSGVDGNTNTKGIGFYQPYDFTDSSGSLPFPYISVQVSGDGTADDDYDRYYFSKKKDVDISTVLNYGFTCTYGPGGEPAPLVCVNGLPIAPCVPPNLVGWIPNVLWENAGPVFLKNWGVGPSDGIAGCALPGEGGILQQADTIDYADPFFVLLPWRAKFGGTAISVADYYYYPNSGINKNIDVGSGTIPIGLGKINVSMLDWGYGDAEFWRI